MKIYDGNFWKALKSPDYVACCAHVATKQKSIKSCHRTSPKNFRDMLNLHIHKLRSKLFKLATFLPSSGSARVCVREHGKKYIIHHLLIYADDYSNEVNISLFAGERRRTKKFVGFARSRCIFVFASAAYKRQDKTYIRRKQKKRTKLIV